LDRHLGYLSFQRRMASLGGSQKPRLLSRHGHRTALICSIGDLWLYLFSEVRFCFYWWRRHGVTDRRIVSVVVCGFPRSEQEYRLIKVFVCGTTAVLGSVLNLFRIMDEQRAIRG
jgi:hypothetical protein